MKSNFPSWIKIPVLFFIVLILIELFVGSENGLAIMEHSGVRYFAILVLLILIAMEIINSAVEGVMFRTLSKEAQERYLKNKELGQEDTWLKKLYGKLTLSKPIETEKEIILDHNYDGIKELDNVLPPWWKYLFYGSMIFAVIYLFRFHVAGGYDQIAEFEEEMGLAEAAIAEYKRTARDLIDISTVEFLEGEGDLAKGKELFDTNCAVCHKNDGGGGIGPNLTDPYWILGGGIKNVFNTISEGGRDGKGMIAWKNNMQPLEMAQVASYVLTLEGTTPAEPKAAEGDKWEEGQ